MQFLTTVVSALFAAVPLIAAFSNPLSCSGTCTDTHDPSLIRRSSDGTWFRFATGGGIDIYSASTVQGPWSYVGVVLADGSSIDNSGSSDAWAPDVHEINGQYYVYYAVSSFGTQDSAIGVATSATMAAGSWTDHGSTGVVSTTGSNFNAIDPNYIQVDGVNYLNFGSFWGDIFQTTLSSDVLAWTGGSEYNIEYNATGTRPSEGSYVYQYGDYYYLFWSSGICCDYNVDLPAPGDEYKIMVCRSETVTGNYVDEKGEKCTSSGGTLVLGSHGDVYGPGGQGIFDHPTLGPIIYYHYVDTTVGYADGDKLLGVNVIDWVNGWPTV